MRVEPILRPSRAATGRIPPMFSSTLLTLLVLPVLYRMVHLREEPRVEADEP